MLFKGWVPILLTVLMGAVSVHAQPSAAGEPHKTFVPNVKIASEELPRYFVVETFFEDLVEWSSSMEPGDYRRLLAELEIDAGSREAAILTRAALESVPILEMQTVDPGLMPGHPDEYLQFQWRAIRQKAKALGETYAHLSLELQAAGFDVGRLERYLGEKVRPRLSLWSDNPEELAVHVSVVGEFDEIVHEKTASSGMN